jgi:ribonuclease BN (tRNA processing enzyme)
MVKWDWQGKDFRVKVLFSAKGLATQVLVSSRQWLYLLDCGDGTSRDLALTGLPWVDRLQAILISHDHPDHTAGLFGVLTYMRLRGRKKTVFVLSPEQCVFSLLSFFRDSTFAGFPFELEFNKVDEETEFHFEDLSVLAFHALHRQRTDFFGVGGLLKAVGYLLQGPGGEKVFYSGDTGWFPGIEDLIRGADLALIEATFDFPKGPERHLTLKEAEELGKLAKKAIYIHR